MATQSQFLTTGQIGRMVGQPEWKIRRIVDSLSPAVPMFANKRLIAPDRLGEITVELAKKRKRGPKPRATAATAEVASNVE